MRFRFLVVGLATAMLASACAQTPEADVPTPSSAAGPTVTEGTSPPAGTSDDLPAALAAAGIEIIDEPEGPGSGLQLWSFQVDNLGRELDAGSGYLGSEIDALAGSPAGLPFSYLLAGWLSASATPAAEAARGLMGDQPWHEAPSLVYPTSVLVMFVGDAIQAGASASSQGVVILASLAQSGVCSTLAGWVNSVLDFIFESLKVNTENDGFLGWLGAVWNAAVDLARDVVSGLVEVITAPIVSAITGALAVIGTLSMISSLLKPWELEVTPTREQTRFAVGDEADIEEQFMVSVDTGLDVEWPAALVDCASVAGLELPDPSLAAGAEIEWKTAGLPPLGEIEAQSDAIGDDNTAALDWVTGRETSDQGSPNTGKVATSVTVTSQQVEELQAMLEHLITGQVPTSPPFGAIVSSLFNALAGPVFEALAEMVQVRGAGSVSVVHHDDEAPTSTAPPAGAGIDSCVVGTWISTDWTLPGPIPDMDGTGGAGAEVAIEPDGSTTWDFDGMEPVVQVDSAIDVTTELHSRGGAVGTVSTTGGSWETEVDVSGMEGFSVDNIIGEIPLEGGPGLFVGVLDGTYTCSGDTLTITTLDPVQGVPITIVLRAG